MTDAVPQAGSPKQRIVGVDVARGFALFGMMAVHTFDTFTNRGTPTPATYIAGGRSAATFVFVAGVSLAFLSGGPIPLRGPRRAGAAAGIVVRGLLVGVIGLALVDLLDQPVNVILPYYALMFLLAIPLLGLPPRTLGWVTTGIAVLGPLLLVGTWVWGIAHPWDQEPGFGFLVHDPVGLLTLLLFTGAYPVVVSMAYICAGLAVGRLDLTSRRVAGRLLGAGVALVIVARAGSWILLHPLGGLNRLIEVSEAGGGVLSPGRELLWEPEPVDSWWFLALPSPHAHTPIDLVHTLGSAMAVLGAALLLTRWGAAARVLRPVADVGSMTLTLYSAHLVLLATGVFGDRTPTLYLVMVMGALAFAVLWRRFGQGPLERPVALAAGWARRAVERTFADPDRGRQERGDGSAEAETRS
ncbi:MAG TPA: heparan-alpha-glucosaminide N-acetyltransferase domain-containing protein [Kineosporiaceae bacterium]|nr:heparan-alpha-glucosaminide N-acetyltransferase domain-containing protein [Kineosporiaceae bacterium]